MQIILTATEQQFCGDLPDVSVFRGSILDVACDTVVSPANSFGFMGSVCGPWPFPAWGLE